MSTRPHERVNKTGTWPVLIIALIFPGVMAWLDYAAVVSPESGPNRLMQTLYVFGKLFQFGLPIVFVTLTSGRFPWPGLPNARGLLLGLAFGGLVAFGTIGLYFVFLRDTSVFQESPDRIKHKLSEFGMNSPAGFALFAVVISVPHSLLEEYYWRWFVFGRLREFVPWRWALVLSSLAFMGHHVVVLHVYLPGRFLAEVVPFSLAIAVGGGVWAWLYERTGTLYPSWLSHALVDAAIFVIGWDLARQAGG